jgi:hypothetical protein
MVEMPNYYTKLFSGILDSTIWHEPLATKVVWITMLAMADKDGNVWASLPGLADRAKVTRDECESALKKFFEPDPDSRSREHDGRRVEKIDGGWRLLNHWKYRAMMGTEDRREYQRVKQAEYRAKKKVHNSPQAGERAAVKGVEDGSLDPATFEPKPPTKGLSEPEKGPDLKQSQKVPTKPIESWDEREQEENQERVTAQYPKPEETDRVTSTFKKVVLEPKSSFKPPFQNTPPPGTIPEI